jgi:hypothetical protein
MAVLADIGHHAAHKAHTAVRDACQLVDEDDLAYSLALNIIGALLCTAARMIPGKKSHTVKIAVALKNLAELMAHHQDHGDHC